MHSLDLEELAALDAAGALDDAERRQLARELRTASGETRALAAALYSTAEALAAAAPRAAPAAHVRDRLLARLGPRLAFIGADEGWQPHPLPGVKMKVLSFERERGYLTLLLSVPPGTVYPAHHHSGPEECYVISGDVTVAGRRLGPGDFHHADAGTDHGALTTEHGATVLLVVTASDYLRDDHAR